jgi:hypothetical protein
MEAQARNRTWGFEGQSILIRSRQGEPRWGRSGAPMRLQRDSRRSYWNRKLARASRPERASFRHLESIGAVADVDRAVGAPFPAAVVSEETMVMVMMPKKTMAKMTMAKPVVPVASVSAMPTVTSSEGLTGDGQRSSGQCQRSDCGGNDRLGLRHGRLLLSWGRARIALR